jgi:hypothetical protein
MTGPNHALLLERLYGAFKALDGDAMEACYARDARFADPVFTLEGREQIGGMWRMLCSNVRGQGRDVWKLDATSISADALTGRARWEAHYRFSATGRLVHNVVEGRFTFKDGLIATHRDTFGFWRWSRQALGAPGWLVGWTPMLRRQVRARAASNLRAFQGKPP